MDYDSDYETKADASATITDVDPYSGSSFSSASLRGTHRSLQAYFSPRIGGRK